MPKIKLKNLEKKFYTEVKKAFDSFKEMEAGKKTQEEFEEDQRRLNKFINKEHVPVEKFNDFWEKYNVKIVSGSGISGEELVNTGISDMTSRYLVLTAKEKLLAKSCQFKICENHTNTTRGCKKGKCNQSLEKLKEFRELYFGNVVSV